MGINQAFWIWRSSQTDEKNIFMRFRRRFEIGNLHEVKLHITACSTYVVFINGERLGQGPPRAWPEHYQYDSYNLTPWLEMGSNVIAVLVHHLGIGTMQRLHTPAGLLACIETQDHPIVTDESWQAAPEHAFEQRVPRISIQMGFEEQYDARQSSSDWTTVSYDDSAWERATVLAPAKNGPVKNLQPRTLPFLTATPRLPLRLIAVEAVRPVQQVWSLDLRPYFNPHDRSADFLITNGFLFTQIHAANDVAAVLTRIHAGQSHAKLNGVEVPAKLLGENYYSHVFQHDLPLRAGWNTLLIDYRQREHLTRYVATLQATEPLTLAWRGAEGGGAWTLLGPFEHEHVKSEQLLHFPFRNVVTTTLQAVATPEMAEQIWQDGIPTPQTLSSALAVEIRKADVAVDDVFARAYCEVVSSDTPIAIQNPEALLGADGTWTTIQPTRDGSEVRLLLDFGTETVGYFSFELSASAGTIIDCIGFENRQSDGALDWTEGCNNSMRYICREGRQRYCSIQRRGLRYAYLIVRQLTAPLQLRRFEVRESLYPQLHRGTFACSDTQLDRIWETGARTLACSSEDTYVDCPAYEQVHWVGDARNEALVDWIVNGDHRLWQHCLLQAAHSLERSPLVESHVPSAWPVILPAWSLLWLRSCREYYLFTGDRRGAEELWPWVLRNIAGVKQFMNAEGLFEIRAWNMFDWAAMDTPDNGAITHQNCQLVMALRETAELAEWLDQNKEAKSLRGMAENLTQSINRCLYDEARQAYVDARDGDGKLSSTFSQQTQTVALVSGVAQGERAEKSRRDMLQPPPEFVSAGSPFFMFFLLEALQQEGNSTAVLREIRDKWGFMLEQGATTFWEMWSGKGQRLSRSHCHGWSAAPTFFLSTYVLGVQPLMPGFARTRLAPHPGDLRWARGKVPTPHGEIEVEWEQPLPNQIVLRFNAPPALAIEIVPPAGNVTINLRS